MRLYSVPLSPFSARVRLSVYRKGLEGQIAIVAPPEGNTRSDAYLALNPMGQVPLLELDDGTLIPESATIVEYLEDVFPTPSLSPADPKLLARARLFLRLPDIHFRGAPRTLIGMRDPATRQPEVVAEAMGNIDRALSYVDHFLNGGPWAVGDHPSIADSALIPILNVIRLIGDLYQEPGLLTRHAQVNAYWEVASSEPVNARVIAEQRSALAPARAKTGVPA